MDDREGLVPPRRSRGGGVRRRTVDQVGSDGPFVVLHVNLAVSIANSDLLNRSHEHGLDPLTRFDLADVLNDWKPGGCGPFDVLGTVGQQIDRCLLQPLHHVDRTRNTSGTALR